MKDKVIDQMNLEKDIEEAANEYSGDNDNYTTYFTQQVKEAFIAGVKSIVARAYWKDKIRVRKTISYTEEEVKELCQKAIVHGMTFNLSGLDKFPDWFNQNKKK